MLKHKIRLLARNHLPPQTRKIVGGMAGNFYMFVIRPIEGFIFDLWGGQFNVDGCRLEIPKNLTSVSFRSCFFEGDYETEERGLIRDCVRPEDSVLEMGACLGIVSCVTNKLLKDKARHVVVEGNPYLNAAIQRNREINGCGFLVENCAVSDQAEVTFFLNPKNIHGSNSQRASNQQVRVPGRSWRELDERYGPFSVLIIDIEGSELQVLEGGRDLLGKYRLVVIEMHPWAIGEEGVARCKALLKEAGLFCQATAGDTEAWVRVSA